MSESEIRALLRTIRADLDRALRKVVLPTALGAGIALSAGCSDDASTPQPDAMTSDAALVDSASPDQQGVDQAVADGAAPAGRAGRGARGARAHARALRRPRPRPGP